MNFTSYRKTSEVVKKTSKLTALTDLPGRAGPGRILYFNASSNGPKFCRAGPGRAGYFRPVQSSKLNLWKTNHKSVNALI